MPELKSELLFKASIDIKDQMPVGPTPAGMRIVANLAGGALSGRVNGEVLQSGADWLLIGADGAARIDVRAVARLDDGALLYVIYFGRLVLPPEMAANIELAYAADPSAYYIRTAPTFETASEKYGWLNRIQAVGKGKLRPGGIDYDVFEIK